MIEKCIIYVSSLVYSILIHDMYAFECVGKSGEINKNKFLNTLISNFYLNRLEKRSEIRKELDLKALPDSLGYEEKEKIIDECNRVINDQFYEDTDRFHDCSLSLYPTKETEELINDLFEVEINGKIDKSVFFRGILNEYSQLPQYIRERIIKRNEIKAIKFCIINNREVIFKFGEVEKHVLPYWIIPSRSESFAYLLGYESLPNGKRTIFSSRISKIVHPRMGEKYEEFSGEDINKFENIRKYGVEFATGKVIETKVQFTKQGWRRFNFSYIGKPYFKVVDPKNRIVLIHCTLPNFIEYFRPFLKDAVVLDNEELRQKMEDIYQEGVDAYKAIGKQEVKDKTSPINNQDKKKQHV